MVSGRTGSVPPLERSRDTPDRRWLIIVAVVAFLVVPGLAVWAVAGERSGAPDVVDVEGQYLVQRWASGLDAPTDLGFLPDGRALVAEKGGWEGAGTATVQVLDRTGAKVRVALRLPVCTDAERGLLGLAIDPRFASNGYVYLYYTRQMNGCHVAAIREVPIPGQRVFNRVSRFRLAGDAIDPASERVLVDAIPAFQSAHNAGGLAFLPDGTLLVGTGDATLGRSRDVHSYAGKVLRLDVTGMSVVPRDNPFAAQAAGPRDPAAVVWAIGFRNPFRLAVDPGSGIAVAADVGSEPPDAVEEVDVLRPGADYGFPESEGATDDPSVVDPAYGYDHHDGCVSVTGGQFAPRQFVDGLTAPIVTFADLACGRVWAAALDGSAVRTVYRLATVEFGISDIEAGPDGALYLLRVGPGDGGINRLAARRRASS
jgi:glucose/arabinose dehydrogenase